MLSRRHFLQLAGIAVSAQALPNLSFSPAPLSAPAFETIYGRALATTPIYAAPNLDAPLLQQMWSDTVAPILNTEGDWYRLRGGYALREHVQPMTSAAHYSDATIAPPFWAEVSGAVAVIRQWCAADAPAITRIGHGGLLRVVDYLPGWYGVADSETGDLLGWSLAGVWSPTEPDSASPNLSLMVDTTTQRLTIHNGDHVLLTAPISTGRALLPGVYPITGREMSRSDQQTGAPWVLHFGDNLHLTGAYWHNRFGSATPGAALQVTPALARWLYSRAAEVIVS